MGDWMKHAVRFVSRCLCVFCFCLPLPFGGNLSAGDRFAYLDERDPYYPSLNFPKLTTPMWVGEPGVEAVVQLSIDDMGPANPPFKLLAPAKSPEFYYAFLKPAVDRLKAIDGRAPISVYALQASADDLTMQRMLDEGFSIEAHTYTHAVPYFRTDPSSIGGSTLTWCIRDFLDCVSGLNAASSRGPVSWRMPGCDARNTTSPRFFSEVLPLVTSKGDFLTMDSSVFMTLTSADPDLPRELVVDEAGRERFARFAGGIPFTKFFVNSIADYPYPYVINGRFWELPVVMPGDAHGVHAYGGGKPQILDDWKRALDIIVRKQGLFTLCFHPHGYCRPEQIAEFVDHVAKTYGGKVKFLTTREIQDRLTKHLCDGEPLRSASGADNGVRLLDVNGDGFLDVVIGNSRCRETRVWQPESVAWESVALPVALVANEDAATSTPTGVHFFRAATDGRAGLAVANADERGVWHFDDGEWIKQAANLPEEIEDVPLLAVRDSIDRGVRFRDVNGDGLSDLIVNNDSQNAIWFRNVNGWTAAPFALPDKNCLVNADGQDQGLRFVDLDADGDEDAVLSNERDYWVRLFDDAKTGWRTVTRTGKPGDAQAIPLIAQQGELMGVWFHSGHLVQVNEFTTKKSDHTDRVSFAELCRQAP